MISQSRISELTGISQAQLSRIFDGKTYGTTSAIKIGSVLNIPWQAVFSKSGLDLYHALAKKIEETTKPEETEADSAENF